MSSSQDIIIICSHNGLTKTQSTILINITPYIIIIFFYSHRQCILNHITTILETNPNHNPIHSYLQFEHVVMCTARALPLIYNQLSSYIIIISILLHCILNHMTTLLTNTPQTNPNYPPIHSILTV
jgi:hypothetical protein